MSKEKRLSYTISNTYSTLNEHTENTKTVWLVFHGIGYLSRYFLKYFKHLNPEENYIIAPQAQSKYYLNGEYRHIGASWLTKENTEEEIKNMRIAQRGYGSIAKSLGMSKSTVQRFCVGAGI